MGSILRKTQSQDTNCNSHVFFTGINKPTVSVTEREINKNPNPKFSLNFSPQWVQGSLAFHQASLFCLRMAAKVKSSRLPPRKTTLSWATVFTALIMVAFFVLIILALGILSTSRESPRAHDLSTIARSAMERYLTTYSYCCTRVRSWNSTLIWLFLLGIVGCREDDGDKGDTWVEVVSWEPRAFIYHNFLVHS